MMMFKNRLEDIMMSNNGPTKLLLCNIFSHCGLKKYSFVTDAVVSNSLLLSTHFLHTASHCESMHFLIEDLRLLI